MRVIGADPFTLYDKNSGYYYIYSTSNESKNNRTFYIHRSTDLINFEFVDYALDLTKNNWGKDWFWAPECYYNEKTKRYFLFYSARVKDELLEYYFNDKTFAEISNIHKQYSRSWLTRIHIKALEDLKEILKNEE